MRWRLLIEEFGPELVYLQGKKNIVADALSRLDISPTNTQEPNLEQLLVSNAECFATDTKLPSTVYPVFLLLIHKLQQEDSSLQDLLKTQTKYILKNFYGGGRSLSLICFNDKNVVPKSLQYRLVQWYHIQLCHPRETRTEATIR